MNLGNMKYPANDTRTSTISLIDFPIAIQQLPDR